METVDRRVIAVERHGNSLYRLYREKVGGEWVFYIWHTNLWGNVGCRKCPNLKGIVYVAGPMRGKAEHNFPAFDAARDMLIAEGYYVFSPADMDRQHGIGSDIADEAVAGILDSILDRDCSVITRCNHIYLLPGWDTSSGVRPEAVLAFTLREKFIMGTPIREVPGIAVVAVIGHRLIGMYAAEEKAAAQKEAAGGGLSEDEASARNEENAEKTC
jgi:hypothetical protein